ncbi:MAG: hypothetical protein QOI34_745 [Verrucomicrobiota bacterium]
MGEEAVDVPDLVSEEKSKAYAEHAGSGSEMSMKQTKPRGVGDRHRNSRGHQHHTRDGSETEDDQITQGPDRSLDDGQDKEGNGCGTGQAMNDTNDDRPDASIPFHSTENAIQSRRRHGGVEMAMRVRAMSMRVSVNIITMAVYMFVRGIGGNASAQGAQRPSEIERPQQYQHKGDTKFQTQTKPFRNHDTKEYNRAAHEQQGEAMADSPKYAGERGASNAALAANNGGNGNDMIRVGCVPHAEKETKEEDGNESDHDGTELASAQRSDLIAHSCPSVASAAFPQAGHSSVATGMPDRAPSQYFGRPRYEQ